MWSTSPQSTATPSRRRTRVRRVTLLGACGCTRRSELPGQHGSEDVRADRGQGDEPFRMPDEGTRQDEHRKVPAGEAVEERLDSAPPFGIKSFPHPDRLLDHYEGRDVAEHREASQDQGYGPPRVPVCGPGDAGIEREMDDVIENDIQLLAEGRLHELEPCDFSVTAVQDRGELEEQRADYASGIPSDAEGQGSEDPDRRGQDGHAIGGQ